MTLHNEQDAIKQAVEAGYEFRGQSVFSFTFDHPKSPNTITLELGENQVEAVCMTVIHELLSDPAFWQALGKARGWMREGGMHCDHYNPKANEPGEKGCAQEYCTYGGYHDPLEMAQKWFFYKITNDDLNQFWQTLP